jgi:hypothetical protein
VNKVGRVVPLGHIHLATLPQTKKWRQVVDLIATGKPDNDIIAASAIAAESDLSRAAQRPVFVDAVQIICLIPFLARQKDFGAQLRLNGIDAGTAPDLASLLSAAQRRLADTALRTPKASDFDILVSRSLSYAISNTVANSLPGLFTATSDDVRVACANLGSSKGFPLLARSFFGHLVERSLRYWLDRHLSTHIGEGRRFPTLDARKNFDVAITTYATEATRIIQEFSSGWYGKTLFTDRTISPEQAARYGHVAFKKIGEELRRKRDADG